ncbi:thioredoxin domain-containing protein [Planctomicrobium sp. SH668]|uniref:thioredoxin domain-containing protein n=1 Tax=Planctomicrobium sp. SH668 TaxID=3448126 RepID=UPI003F5C81A7
MAGSPLPNQPSNRLIAETSPYLLQHAYNPVDWYPWGEEAFEKAKREGKPIFLSVGYSACHWCHVMERESFENVGIAKFLNEHFVSIKVDREERPDVDQIYMSAVQLITRRGGWPMSVFLTPEATPFYGGTYWPPTSRMGMPGFIDILQKLNDYWVTKREEINTSASELLRAIQNMAAPVFETTQLNEETLKAGGEALTDSADRRHGGFGGAPKFPHPMDLRVLLRGWKRFGDDDALKVVELTLKKMANGGIYDHLGGGFHRYSTDAIWLAPHFEKMLYDNALLVPVYLEMYQITHDPFYARVVRETLDYVLREMTSDAGGFFSTQDADTEGEEGKFFVWSAIETANILGKDDAEVFDAYYDVSASGNWEGHSILNVPRPLDDVANALVMEPKEVEDVLARSRKKMLLARSRRVAPGRDEKVLSGWNGMMVAALAQASAVLNDDRYQAAAVHGARFLLSEMRDDSGRLFHSWKDGVARFNGFLDDYACVIDGLVELFQVTSDEDFLQAAVQLADDAIARFEDQDVGGFFYTANDHEKLIARTKDSQDNATPSGNGMMATALAKLGKLTSNERYLNAATRTLNSISSMLVDHPRAGGQSLLALDFLLGPTYEIVVRDSGDHLATEFSSAVWQRFIPNRVYLRWSASAQSTLTAELLNGKEPSQGSSFYLCEQGLCQLPCHSIAEAESLLDTVS